VAALRPLNLRYSGWARSQLLAILEYVTQHAGREVATNVAESIREAMELLRYFPYAGRVGRVLDTRE
jgi:plasmid stabilization system protein ParE